MHAVLREDQTYRIDHYLGKETVQNILAFRFANGIWEPLWNGRYIDHVQLTVAEAIGVEGRGGYFEQAGILRDMVQNHMFQFLCLSAMEPPVAFEAEAVRDEKLKVLQPLRPLPVEPEGGRADWWCAGSTARGFVNGQEVIAYRDEQGVAKDSAVETYVAMKLQIDNWRWAGVPFYLRAGKALPKRVTEIAIHFKRAPHAIFGQAIRAAGSPTSRTCCRSASSPTRASRSSSSRRCRARRWSSCRCRWSSATGPRSAPSRPRPTSGSSSIASSATAPSSRAATRSRRRGRGSIASKRRGPRCRPPPFPNYAAGTWGPAEADRLIESEGRVWRKP